MKEKILWFYAAALPLIIALVFLGCGQQQSSTTTTTLGPVSGVLAITGKLNTGVVAASVFKAAGTGALAVARSVAADYTVAAVSQDTGLVYFAGAKTGSDGSFDISGLPSGESYFLDIMDSSNKLAAPVTFGVSGKKPVMALAPTNATTDLGLIVYDSSQGAAAPTQEPTTLLDTSAKATAKTGTTAIPVGALNFGKGTEARYSGTYDPAKADGDQDGLPNCFDADNNGDGIVDELDGLFTKESFVAGALPNFFPYFFSNLKVDFDRRDSFKTGTNAYSDLTIAVGITSNAGKGGSSAKTISSVKVTGGPAWLTKANIVNGGGLWSASNYAVPAKGNDIYEVQLSGLKPLTDVNAGDTLKYLITYTDGSSAEAMKMLSFIFTDIPRVTQFRVGSAATPWQTILSTTASGPLASASTSEVYLRWTRPKDETGAEVIGGKYTFEYNAKGGVAKEIEVYQDANSSIATLEGGYKLGSLADANLTQSEFMVGLCIRSLANDNSAENVRFTKSW